MTRPVRVFINGFGRIGRTVFRQLSNGANDQIEIVGLNDITPLANCAYLFQYDSVFGTFPSAVTAGDRELRVNGRRFAFHQEPDLGKLDLSDVDVVMECTGRATTRPIAEAGLNAGAASVLISGPSSAADITVVMGANAYQMGDARIVSNASCTTNAIAPMLRTLNEALAIERAHITTIHCYTASQPTVDQPSDSFARGRAAAVSMVPTTTSAASQITRVLPEFEGKLSVSAVRVPCISVSAVDAVLQFARLPKEPFAEFLRETFAGSPLIGVSDDPCVSSDFRGRPESLILALPETQTTGPHQARIFGWYDNEWGFSARMIDMAVRMAARDNTATDSP
ncbi:type I glyceraldehyde-3-phosphate dehydrogenase [Falsihalocynthiibacter sp. SS001]|uniref:type I glyceraldehyde-3-phosphate dehydrogenase n=1 Tax=Falsihalocynthiibacter sp. SS001 TaxID=3349698 RepID=UPI0036D254EB